LVVDSPYLTQNFQRTSFQGVLIGFKGELIHIFNKNEGALCHSEYFNDIRHRHNVLLLGDSLGDLHMADGVEEISTCLKIGYLNDKVTEMTFCVVISVFYQKTDDHIRPIRDKALWSRKL